MNSLPVSVWRRNLFIFFFFFIGNSWEDRDQPVYVETATVQFSFLFFFYLQIQAVVHEKSVLQLQKWYKVRCITHWFGHRVTAAPWEWSLYNPHHHRRHVPSQLHPECPCGVSTHSLSLTHNIHTAIYCCGSPCRTLCTPFVYRI